MAGAGHKAARKGNGGQFYECIVPGTSQKLAFTGTSAQSAAVGSATELVRLVATSACTVAAGGSPTANASTSMMIPANTPTFLPVAPGDKIAAVQVSAGGDLYITEATIVS